MFLRGLVTLFLAGLVIAAGASQLPVAVIRLLDDGPKLRAGRIIDPKGSVRSTRAAIEGRKQLGLRPGFLEAYELFIAQRASPYDEVDWDAYARADASIDLMEPARLRTDLLSWLMTPAPNAQWQFMGPRNLDIPFRQFFGPRRALAGRVNAIAVAPNDQRVIYIASPGGGIFKTTDRGLTWAAVTDGVANWKGLQATEVVVDPTNANNVFAGAGDVRGFFRVYGRGLFRSTNAGGTWTRLHEFENRPIVRILIDPEDSRIITVFTGARLRSNHGTIEFFPGKVYRSTNRGDSFEVISAGVPASAVWMSASIGGKDDAGLRWYWATSHEFVAADPTGVRPKLYRSLTRGRTWQEIDVNRADGTPYFQRIHNGNFNAASISVAASPVNSEKVFLLSGGDRLILRSDTAGVGWLDISGGFPGDPIAQAAGFWAQSGYNYHINCSHVPGTKDDIVYAGLISLAASNDDGATWNHLTQTYVNPASVVPGSPTQAEDFAGPAQSHNDAHCMAVDPQNPNQVYIGNDGGIYPMQYDPAIKDWLLPETTMNAGLPIAQFYTLASHFTNADGVIGGTQDNASPRSYGANSPRDNLAPNLMRWNNAGGGDGGAVAVTHQNNGLEQYSFVNAAVWRTTDAWSQTIRPQSFAGAPPNPVWGKTEPMSMTTADNPRFPGAMASAPGGDWTFVASANHVFRTLRGLKANALGFLYESNNIFTAAYRMRLGPAAGSYAASGQSFPSPAAANQHITAMATAPGDPGRLYVGTSNGQLWMSSNALAPVTSVTFTQINGGQGANTLPAGVWITSIAVHPFYQDWVIVGTGGTGNQHLYECTRVTAPVANRFWKPIAGGGANKLPDVSLNAVAIDMVQPGRTLYAATDLGVFMTTDGGLNWTDLHVNRGLPYVQVNALTLRAGTGFLSAATFGRGVWRIPVGTSAFAGFGITPSPWLGGTGTGRVYLAAPSVGNTVVSLSSSKPDVIQVPATITIANGRSLGDFTVRQLVTPSPVRSVDIEATIGTQSVRTLIRL